MTKVNSIDNLGPHTETNQENIQPIENLGDNQDDNQVNNLTPHLAQNQEEQIVGTVQTNNQQEEKQTDGRNENLIIDEEYEAILAKENEYIEKNKMYKDEKDNNDENPEEKKATTVSYFKLQCKYALCADFVYIIIGCVGALGVGSGLPAMSFLLGDTINKINETGGDPDAYLQTIKDMAFLFLYFGAGIMVASCLMVFGWTLAGKRLVNKLKNEYFRVILEQEQSWFDQINAHEFATKVEVQTKVIESGLGDKVGNSIYSISTCIMAYVIGFLTSWKLSLVMISTLPFMAIGGYCLTNFMISEDQMNREFFEKAGGIAEEIFYYIKTVVSFGNFSFEINRFISLLKESRMAGIKSGLKAASVLGFTFFVIYASYSLAFWYGSICIANGDINGNTGKPFAAGDVLTVIFAIVFGSYALGQASPNFTAIAKACQAASELFALLERKPLIDLERSIKCPPKDELKGEVTFENITFLYPSRPDQNIFKDLNFVCEAGKTTAIVGESGSGKSTIVNLLERLYDPNSGVIKIDNYDTQDINLEYFRSLLGYVAQEPVLFNTSIKENIIFGRKDVEEEEIRQVKILFKFRLVKILMQMNL